MDLTTARTYRHGREDVLVALARLDPILVSRADGLAVYVNRNGRLA